MAKVSQQGTGTQGRPRAVVRVGDVEALIRQLPGVVAARLAVNDWGGVEEVHVLATTERPAKQIVRDVESSLHARWGLKLDHRKISVAQIPDPGTATPPMRPRLLSVTLATDLSRSRVTARVTLGLPSDEEARFEGEAEGPNLPGHQARIVGMAAVEALNTAMRTDHRLALEEARIIGMGAFQVAVAVVALATPHVKAEQRILAGAAVVEGDPVDAVVKACLQATNRFMERHILRRVPRPAADVETADAAGAAEGSADGGGPGDGNGAADGDANGS